MNRFFRELAAIAAVSVLAAASSALAGDPPATNVSATGQGTATSPAAVRSSASYSLAAETTDLGGGGVVGSAAYTVSGTAVGQPVASSVQGSTTYADKPGYVGQLYDLRGLSVGGAGTNNVNERATLQLAAAPLFDDGTLSAALDPSTVTWSVVGGPLVSVSTTGLATAGTVYQNTLARVGASAVGGLNGTGILTVINLTLDDYGPYAGDGIDDAWQVRYFGANNPQAGPNVDADGTGQTNLFKYLAGLDPLDPTSRFVLGIGAVSGQPGTRILTFSPVYSGRTYTVQATSDLSQPNWTTLPNVTVSVTGNTGTVMDPNASGSARFYRVLISVP